MENKKSFLAMLVLSIIFSFLGIGKDLEFIKPEDHQLYIIGRVLWGTINIILFFFLQIKKTSVSKLLIPYLITMMLYSFHGQWFVPCYYLGLVEIILIIGLFFPVEKTFFRITVIISGIIMCIIIAKSPATYNVVTAIDEKFRYDAIMAVFIISMGSLFGHTFITLKRQEKDEAYRKFLDIGKYSSFLFHDFKGLLTTPIFYADMLQQTSRSGKNTDEIIVKLNEDLTFLQEYAKEIMKLTLPDSSAYQQEESLDLNKVEKTINVLLRKPLHKIQLNFIKNGTPKKTINSFKLIKVLYNAAMNSAENFKGSDSINNPQIDIEFSDNVIIVKDNGSGFPENILKKLNQEDTMISTKDGGSGIGTAIIKDLVKSMDGNVKFYNKNGAVVYISFN